MSGSGAIAGGTASWSGSWTPSATGTYYWIASYPGDANNNAFATSCGDANEQVVISSDLLPDAVNDTNTAMENGPAVNGDVSTNDTPGDPPTPVTSAVDDDGDAITLGVAFATDAGGSLTLNADGTYSYTPPAWNLVPPGGLTEVFTYTITDADGDTDTATLTITVTDTDRFPNAVNDTNTAVENGPAVNGDVSTNDTPGDPPTPVTSAVDDDGDPLVLGVAFPTDAGGSLTLNADGTYSYTPPAWNLVPPAGLTEVFTYTITDADGDTDTATLTITVTDTDRFPNAVNDTNTAVENGPAVNGDVSTNDTPGDPPTPVTSAVDDDGDPLVLGVAFPTDAGGSLTLNADGTYSYTPPAWNLVPPGGLTEVFTYTITDADGDTDTATLTITVTDISIGIAKRTVGAPTEVSPGTFDVTLELLVRNYGNVPLSAIQVTDDLAATFPSPAMFTVQSVTSSDFSVNAGYDGASDTELLDGTDTLNVGAQGSITIVVRVVPTSVGPYENTAIASGYGPSEEYVTDLSQDGLDPDSDEDGDPTDNNEPTPITFGATLFDPPIGIKTLDDSLEPVLNWTMVWINNSNIVAVNSAVSDPIPAGTSYVASGASSGYPVPVTAPLGSTNVGVSCTDTSALTSTSQCYYEGPTVAYLRGRIVWEGIIGPDLGATDAATAVNEIAINFSVQVNTGIEAVINIATIDSDLNGDGDTTDVGEQRVAEADATWEAEAEPTPTPTPTTQGFIIPATGFAPGKLTFLDDQPEELAYHKQADMWLEIPSLGVEMPILGVPITNKGWDVSWLGNQAGWLEGTAFPTTLGNSVITGHVYMPNGKSGPLVNLDTLKWGNRIIVHFQGQASTYEVRQVVNVQPTDSSAFRHEEESWVTLVTCRGYNAATNTYSQRTVVRAVLISVQPDTTEPTDTR
jgi:LPXTG-site transpeptidase (sortase) family protein